MKQGLAKEVDWALAGAMLANEGDDNQLAFFKAFVKECKSWGTDYQVGIQLAGVNRQLTDEEKDALSMLSYKDKEATQ